MENNKVLSLLDKAIEILGRCWEGYKPVAGVKPYEAGSCEKEMATQSDMGEIEEVISMLDKAINFYDPTQARDESGRWAGGAGEYGSNKSGTSFVTDAQEQILTNKTDVIQVIQDHHERALKNVTGEDDEPAISDALDRVESVMEAIVQARQEQPQKFYEILGRASDKVQYISRQIGKSSSKAVSQNAGYFENLADAINEIAGVWSDKTSDTWNRKGFEIIKKLDKLIEFYDPSQDRDESGKWSGSGGGGGSSSGGSEKTSGGVVSDEKTQEIKNKVYESIPEEVLDGSKEGSIFNEDALNRSSPLVPHIGGFRGGFPKDHPVREAFRQIAKFTDDSSKEEPTKRNIRSSVEKLYSALVRASDYKDDKGVFDSVVSKIKSIKDSI